MTARPMTVIFVKGKPICFEYDVIRIFPLRSKNMTQTRSITVGPMLILVLSTLSCALFTEPVKPTQIVDLPSMVGKSLQEMTTTLGPSKKMGICDGWDLPEGELSVCYESGDYTKKSMSSVSYKFPPPTVFGRRTAVGSPEEMAALVKIDLQGKKPDSEFRGGYAYDLILNGQAVDVAFDGGPKTIVGVRVHVKDFANE